MDNKKFFELVGNSLVILLSIFIMSFFVLNEKFDLGIKASVVIPLVIVLAIGLVVLMKKFNISNYILLPVIFIDGYFHFTSPLENLIANSPDWVIAFNFFGGNGMPVLVHQIMGIFLLITSLIFVYHLISKKSNWYYYLYKYGIAIVTMIIISVSYMIKLFMI